MIPSVWNFRKDKTTGTEIDQWLPDTEVGGGVRCNGR